MNVLVIWVEIPDEVSFVPMEVAAKDLGKIRRWHNQYINGEDTLEEIAEEISKEFYDDKFQFKYKKITEPLVVVSYDMIIQTGIFS